jgi:hypothetical protein
MRIEVHLIGDREILYLRGWARRGLLPRDTGELHPGVRER